MDAYKKLVEVMTPGTVLKKAYDEVKSYVLEKRKHWVDKLSLGFGNGVISFDSDRHSFEGR